MKKIITFLVILLIAGGIFYYVGFLGQQNAQAAASDLETVAVDRGTLTGTIGVTGGVRPNQSVILRWQTSGTVESISVEIGSMVTNGDELARLVQTSLPQSVILAQADLVSAEQALDDLLNSNIEQARALEAIEAAQNSLEDALNPDLKYAQALEAIAKTQKAVEDAETDLNNSQSSAGQVYIDEAEAELVLLKDELDKAQANFDIYANKPEDNLTRANYQNQLAEAQQKYDAGVRRLNALKSTGDDTDIALEDAEYATALAQLADAEREWERIQGEPTDADIALLEAQLEDAEREWERLKEGPDPDDIAAAEARVAAAKANLDEAYITAPFDAVIADVESQPGDQVDPGTYAFRLDDLSRLLVDVEVSEVDINQVQVGQQVILTFDAVPDLEYSGEIIEIATFGVEKAGVVDFSVSIELKDPDENIKPGMTAAVDIVVDSIADVLLVPNRAVRTVEGERVVYTIDENNALEKIVLTLGASDGVYSQVLESNLKSGDRVVLNPPSTEEFNLLSGPPSNGPSIEQ
jgi:HlyD family secretion protein